MRVLFSGIVCFVGGGVLTLFFPERQKGSIMSWCGALGALFVSIAAFPALFNLNPLSRSFTLPDPFGVIRLELDPLSAFFALLIAVMSFLGLIYGNGYLHAYFGQRRTIASHYVFLGLLIASMLGVVLARNALAFLIAWEIMSLSSFFLVIFENEKEDVLRAGLNYLIAMHIGVCFLIAGFGLLAAQSGSLDLASFAPILQSNPAFASGIFLLMLVGFGMKAGFFPLHTWLPQAHPAAPTHVSGLMSGVMIKTGIYGILRMLTLMPTPPIWLAGVVLAVAVISAVLGVMYAIAQRDIKKLLAYSSMENIGIIGIGIGVGMLGLSMHNQPVAMLGFAGGILHVLNHSIFKMLLFYGAGAVYQQTHTRNIEELGGLVHRMKLTSICFLLGSLAISGLPFLNGFISELLLYLGMFRVITVPQVLIPMIALVAMILLAFVGAMALLCFTRVFGIVFLGSPRSPHAEHATETGNLMLMPMAILSLLAIVIGIFPQYAVRLVQYPVLEVVQSAQLQDFPALHVLATLSTVGVGFVALCLFVYVVRVWRLDRQPVDAYKTWDCGYQAGNTRMQYTGSSYAEPFLALVEPFVPVRRKIVPPTGLFPQQAHYESHTHDLVELYAVQPAVNGINRFLGLFTWIQSGSTQKYILYGIVFLAITLAIVLSV